MRLGLELPGMRASRFCRQSESDLGSSFFVNVELGFRESVGDLGLICRVYAGLLWLLGQGQIRA